LQVKHLKRWDAVSLIKSDMLDRAAPWTELIWNQIIRQKKRLTNDLNLGLRYRVSLLSSFLLIVSAIGLLFTGWALPLMLICVGVFLLLQIPFFRFFQGKRGFGFAIQALGWRFAYDVYSGLGFSYGSLRFANASARKILSEAFARIDSIALGTGVGTVCGGGICTATLFVLARGSYPLAPKLSLLEQFFPAYTVTWSGSLIGFGYGFIIGFIFGFAFACTRNIAMRLHLGSRKIQRFVSQYRQ
jgi:hypothetical protein